MATRTKRIPQLKRREIEAIAQQDCVSEAVDQSSFTVISRGNDRIALRLSSDTVAKISLRDTPRQNRQAIQVWQAFQSSGLVAPLHEIDEQNQFVIQSYAEPATTAQLETLEQRLKEWGVTKLPIDWNIDNIGVVAEEPVVVDLASLYGVI